MAKIDQLAVKAKDAFSAEKFELALHYSNRVIDELQQQTVNALELRASIWEKKSNLKEELKDALLITKYDEFKTSAYLRAAKVYSKQERLQEAIDILQQALYRYPVEVDDNVIEQQMAKAENRLEHRMDFITVAPYDIVCNILSYLTPPEAFECLAVSDRWREVLLNCPTPWENVEPNLLCWYDGFDMVPTVSHHVQRLSLRGYPPRCIARGFRFIKECPFTRLKHLTIADATRDNPLLLDPLYEALHQLADTLTEFNLQASYIEFSLGKLLTICPKLISVDLFVDIIQDWDTGMPTTTLLTTVSIASNLPVNRKDLVPFFRCARFLKKLMIRPMRNDILDISPFIEQCSPNLSDVFTGFGGHTNIFHWTEPCKFSSGLERVSLGNVGSMVPWSSRLEGATDSLRTLHINAANDGRVSTLADWRPLSSFVMHKLACLSINAELGSALYQHLPSMLHSYPVLERLKLVASGVFPSVDVLTTTLNNIFAAVAKLKKLHDLHLDRLPLDGQGFGLLIKKHTAQESSTLTSLDISPIGISNDVLYDITRIRSLEHLTFDHSYLPPDSIDIDELARLVAVMPCLKKLSFSQDVELTDNAIRYIASSKSLESLDTCTEFFTEEAHHTLEHLFLHRSR